MSCKVGIEGFANTFEHFFKDFGRCVVYKNNAIDYASQEFVTYNNTVCSFAEACSKVNTYANSFFSCVQNTFCTYAPETVKATGQLVYQAHKEYMYNSAVESLPWVVGGVVVGGVAAGLIDRYAPKNMVTGVLSFTAKGLCVVSSMVLVDSATKIHSI